MRYKILCICVLLFMLTGCTLVRPDSSTTVVYLDDSSKEENKKNQTEKRIQDIEPLVEYQEPEHHHVQLLAVGDIMVHRWQLEGAYNAESGLYDFSHSFEYIAPYIKKSDYAIANLETTLAGKKRGYQGYPRFNTPEILAKNLKDAGFDMVTTANNHSMDSNAEGVLHTINILEEVGLDYVGTYKSQEDSEQIFIKEINNISFAFLSYTYGTNGIPVPMDQSYLVNTWNMYEENRLEEMYQKVREAKKLNPDFVVIAVHFGNEYHSFPNVHQENIVDQLFQAGADIILGNHAHVLQPIQVRQITKEDGTKKKGIVIYSLGNFISSQKPTKEDPAPKDAGVIFGLDIEKIEGDSAIINNILLIPTWVQWIRKNNKPFHRVIAVEQALRDAEEGQTNFSNVELQTMKRVKDQTLKHLMYYLEEDIEVEDDIYYIRLQN